MTKRFLCGLALALLSGIGAAQDALPPAVLAALRDAKLTPEAMAAAALPLGHRARPWRHRAEVPMQPGSAMKLVTAVVALDKLGAPTTTRTKLLSAAAQDSGVLRGDLVLQGGADPDFGQRDLWLMLRELRDQGLLRIDGNLVLDRERFRPARLDVGAPPFDEHPEGWWNVIPDALLLDGALQVVEVKSDEQALQARLVPALSGVRIDASALQLNDRPCREWDAEWRVPRTVDGPEGVVVVLQGAFPRNCQRREEMQVVERSRYIGLVFAQLWRELGGQWSGRVQEAAAPEGARVLAEHRSRPWGEVLRPLMKTSDNTQARLLFLELGAALAPASAPSTIEAARRLVPAWFAERRIDAPGLVVDNGSGLSRSERITPLTMARLIEWAWSSRHAPDLLATLPVAGVDGTLRNRLKNTAATGTARLKTGTLRNVAALAGVVNDPKGRPWALVVMVNDEIGAAARPVLDALVADFARRGPQHAPVQRNIGPQGEGP